MNHKVIRIRLYTNFCLTLNAASVSALYYYKFVTWRDQISVVAWVFKGRSHLAANFTKMLFSLTREPIMLEETLHNSFDYQQQKLKITSWYLKILKTVNKKDVIIFHAFEQHELLRQKLTALLSVSHWTTFKLYKYSIFLNEISLNLSLLKSSLWIK